MARRNKLSEKVLANPRRYASAMHAKSQRLWVSSMKEGTARIAYSSELEKWCSSIFRIATGSYPRTKAASSPP